MYSGPQIHLYQIETLIHYGVGRDIPPLKVTMTLHLGTLTFDVLKSFKLKSDDGVCMWVSVSVNEQRKAYFYTTDHVSWLGYSSEIDEWV